MPKSLPFQELEKCIVDIKKFQERYIKSGKNDSLARNVDTAVKRFTKLLNTNERLLLERSEDGNLLMLVIAAFPLEPSSKILETIISTLLPMIQGFSLEEQVQIYTAKTKSGLNPLKLAAIQNPDFLPLLLEEISKLEDFSVFPQLLTAMENSNEQTPPAAYNRSSITNLKSKLALLNEKQPELRGKLITARDGSDDACNVVAYAAGAKDYELIKLVLEYAAEANEADPTYLSEPTASSEKNAHIFLFILSKLELVAQLQQSTDLPTLKTMLTVRELQTKKNPVALALALTNPKLLTALLALVQLLPEKDQKVILNQLNRDDKQKLISISDCPGRIKLMLEESLPPRSSSAEFFNATADETASAAASPTLMKDDATDTNVGEYTAASSSTPN